ncbi:MAG: hypothetical protein HY892_16715 [Deltaproteobacteria bacterium]|nr:hypothetical protein [Deltaproteobacteria bacterium]
MAQNNPTDPFVFKNIHLLPILHNRLEFALEVHRRIQQIRPTALAVELPPTLQEKITGAVGRLPFLSAVVYQEKNGRHIYLVIEPVDGIIEALRLGREETIPVFFIDRDTEGYPAYREPLPDPFAVTQVGYEAYCRAFLTERGGEVPSAEDLLRERTMAHQALELGRRFERVLVVCGLAHFPGIIRLLSEEPALPFGRRQRAGVLLGRLQESSSREILSEMPFLQRRYEEERSRARENRNWAAFWNLNRLAIRDELLEEAVRRQQQNSREQVQEPALAVLKKFARNYAFIQGTLTPDFYQLLVAARGAVNDNFAYEVWDLGSHYPYQETTGPLPEIEVTARDLRINQKKIQFYRRFRSFRRRLVPVPAKRRTTPAEREEFKKRWRGDYICSYPPEDIRVEGFGDYLKKKARGALSQEQIRLLPFTASLLDGLDVKETLRHLVEDKIYVREERAVRGRVGSVVFVFDEDEPVSGRPPRFPWKITWLGEHDQESDMAFYATPAGEEVVGPGISRCEYGGFVLSYPPLRMADIWKDRFFDPARSKAERLLLAGIDYSEEQLVAYVASRPPRSFCRTLASSQGKKIVYLPLGQFSPVLLTRIRFFHVLESPELRKTADLYIR